MEYKFVFVKLLYKNPIVNKDYLEEQYYYKHYVISRMLSEGITYHMTSTGLLQSAKVREKRAFFTLATGKDRES